MASSWGANLMVSSYLDMALEVHATIYPEIWAMMLRASINIRGTSETKI
jgi:hypothetical protein